LPDIWNVPLLLALAGVPEGIAPDPACTPLIYNVTDPAVEAVSLTTTQVNLYISPVFKRLAEYGIATVTLVAAVCLIKRSNWLKLGV
jgi:hypothetical protein